MHSENEAQMPTSLKTVIAAYIAALNLLLIAGLIGIWPGASLINVPADIRFLITAALAGALGSCIHLATSFVSYAGHSSLHRSWAVWYLLRPGIGAALALVVYFALHAGLVGGSGEAALNPYGVASVAALSGMFSKQATEKLREIFENICATSALEKPATDTPLKT
jgi:hypothetical protein